MSAPLRPRDTLPRRAAEGSDTGVVSIEAEAALVPAPSVVDVEREAVTVRSVPVSYGALPARVVHAAYMVAARRSGGPSRVSYLAVEGGAVWPLVTYDGRSFRATGRRHDLARHAHVARVVASRAPYVEPAREEGHLDTAGLPPEGPWARRILVPVVAGGEVRAVIVATGGVTGRLRARSLRRLVAVAEVVGAALEASGTADEPQLSSRLLGLLDSVRAVTAERSAVAVLPAIASQAMMLTGADFAALSLADDRGGDRGFAAVGPPVRRPSQAALEGTPLGENRAVRITGLGPDAPEVGRPVPDMPIRSFMGFPLELQERVLGYLYMLGAHRDFTPEDELVARRLAAHASVVIGNADANAALSDLAAVDPLTGLRNRRAFDAALATMTNRVAVLAIDVDNLKPINDRYGHEAGDAVLRELATVLRGMVRTEDVVARVGGDEFAVVLPNADASRARRAAERVVGAAEQVTVDGVHVAVSVGYAATGTGGGEPYAVWRTADQALLRAKRAGGHRAIGGREAMHVQPASDRAMVEAVRRMLSSRSMTALYQPIVDLGGSEVAGYEAVPRPLGELSVADPDMVRRAAEAAGMSRDLDWVSRRAAFEGVPNALTRDDRLLFVGVDVGVLTDPMHDVDQWQLLIEACRIPPSLVVLQVTAPQAIADLRRLVGVMPRYREAGFRFALDNAGEGHATLEALAATVPEFTKIARSLTSATGNLALRSAIGAIVAFANATGGRTIARGVDGPHEAETMRDLGVGFGQGLWLPYRRRALRARWTR